MRRKSERNKAKAPAEKLIEKVATRRTTRRRGKLSPVHSQELENSEEHVTSAPLSDDDKESSIQVEVHSNANEEQESVSASDLIKTVLGGGGGGGGGGEEEEDNGSVWKVARADASPGEIQKLKLCRQRNISDASDGSPSKKVSNKWSESGEGVTEEAESADEQMASSEKVTISGEAEETSSEHPGQESNQEVSDCKENLPETTSANLSDDQTNIDQQADCKEVLPETTSVNDFEQPKNEDNESTSSTNVPVESTSADQSPETGGATNVGEKLPSSEELPVNEEFQDNSSEPNLIISNASKIEEQTINEKDDAQSNTVELNHSENEVTANAKKTSVTDQIQEQMEDTGVELELNQETKLEDETHISDEKNQELSMETETIDISLMENQNNPEKDNDNESDDEVEDEEEEEGEIREELEEEKSPESNHHYRKYQSMERRPSTRKRESASINNDIELDLTEISIEKEDFLEINEKSDDLNVTLSCSKPAKVSLKRSFSARITTDGDGNKLEKSDKLATNSVQNKENHNDNDQPTTTKRRRWGTTVTSDVAPAFSISTDSLKALVPGAKPVSESEVRLTKDDDSREHRKIKNESQVYRSKNDTIAKNEAAKKDQTTDNHIASKRKISIVKDTPRPTSPSPAEAQATKILFIKNLTRPFTLNQIKELLSRTGIIAENGFWMDRVKSKCFVEYANEDQAFETRQALHGISWPLSNPKKLIVEYAKKEDMEEAQETSKDQPDRPTRKTEQSISEHMWPQDKWAREERNNISNKITVVREWDLGKEDGLHERKQKERKDPEKKKRQRSLTPIREAHLPAPARKFKKKEEEPPTAKLLDDLFKKTKATPCIYWLPLTNEQIMVKEEMRRQHMAEYARLEEMRRVERSRGTRRRSRPRK